MNQEFSVLWGEHTAQQLVRYEALFKLIDEIHPLEDALEVSRKVAAQWKYFANVASWRLVVHHGENYTIIDGFRGEARLETVSMLSSWDEHFMLSRIPARFSETALPESPHPPQHLLASSLSEILVIPYAKGNNCYALLSISARHNTLNDIDQKFIRIFGSHFSSLIHNILMHRFTTATLVDKATHDYLTGLLNRGAIIERLEVFFRLSKRTKEPLSIILGDVDHFKRINDTYGHLAGDRVLQHLASTLQIQTRDSDHLGRYGGEEFLSILYPCNAQEAFKAAERKRLSIEKERISIDEKKEALHTSMSFGISALMEGDECIDALLSRADIALYEAKKHGRNRCVIKDTK